MSLNGLDDPKVKEAHDFASAEPGGWFLLKYVSRDEVELLGRGNGGIVEIRNTIAQQEESDPLFGFLRYRRRNVLIKYVPEECSRLVQARVTVHFNAVTEQFSPHDTLFPITTSKELRDNTLSAACSLHTASGSISSSTSSLRRRRLMEIAEDEEEDSRTARRQSTVPEEHSSTAKALSVTGEPTTRSVSPLAEALPDSLPVLANYQSKFSDLDTSPPPPREPSHSETRPRSPQGGDIEPRKSLSSARPELYTTRPKIKLGPRPSLDVGGRPHTSGDAACYRPVSTLPAGLKLSSKGSKKGEKDRPKSQFISEAPSMVVSPPTSQDVLSPSQDTIIRPHTSGGRPATSSGSSIRPLISSTTNNTPKAPFITPERARLMKALELRKKQKEISSTTPAATVPLESQTGPISSTATINTTSKEVPKEVQGEESLMLDGIAKVEDSGPGFEVNPTLRTDESDATRSDSYPVSPTGPSEGDRSTRASSISGSTDETVKKANASKPDTTLDLASESAGSNPETTQISQNVLASKEQGLQLPEIVPVTDGPTEASLQSAERMATVIDTVEAAVQGDQAIIKEGKGSDIKPVSQVAEGVSVPSGDTVKLPEQNSSDSQPQAREGETTPPGNELPSPKESLSKHWKVPRSKFSVQDLKAANTVPDIPTEPLPSSTTMLHIASAPKSPVGSTFSSGSRISHVEENHKKGVSTSKRKKRRAGGVEQIRTDLELAERSGATSDDNFSSDDDLMDELQSAVVQEAKPVQVSKSPSSPVFPSPKKRNTEPIKIIRSPPDEKENEVPGSALGAPQSVQAARPNSRSASASAYLNRINQSHAKPMAKKVNLGSGISQRIKALERLSSLPPGADQIASSLGSTGPPPGTAPAFFAVKKGSMRRASRSPSIADRASSLNRNTPSPGPSHESSPETLKIRERSGSIQSRVDAFKLSPVSGTQSMRSRPESISVTARIIRDPLQPYPAKSEAGKDPSDYAPLDLKESPLVIDHHRATDEPPKATLLERRQSRERRLSNSSRTTDAATKDGRSSITIIKDLINDTRTSFSERRRSITLETSLSSPKLRSPSRPPSTHASPSRHRPMSISSRKSTSSRDLSNNASPPPRSGSISSNNSESGDKKQNRASRMIRRMSSSLSASRKTIAHVLSPTVREEAEPAIENRSFGSSNSLAPPETPTSIDIGDVNVQFPDTLLWKRRSMLLDSQGYLIMSPALTVHGNVKDKAHSGSNRRFHLNEFRTPSIPDADMMEMPNSVVLDFLEGGELQIACEDRAGQKRILRTLQEAHQKWAAFEQ